MLRLPGIVGIGHQARAAVARASDEDDVQVSLPDEAVQMHVDEVQAGRGAPMAEQAGLDVQGSERPGQERVVVEIDLAYGQVVRGPPVGVQIPELFGAGGWLVTGLMAGLLYLGFRSWVPGRGAWRLIPRCTVPRPCEGHCAAALHPSCVITGALARLRVGSSSMPRKPSPSQMRRG